MESELISRQLQLKAPAHGLSLLLLLAPSSVHLPSTGPAVRPLQRTDNPTPLQGYVSVRPSLSAVFPFCAWADDRLALRPPVAGSVSHTKGPAPASHPRP